MRGTMGESIMFIGIVYLAVAGYMVYTLLTA